ncbi:MAG: hypothetical protein Q3M30_12890 [Candidatus Electrothrix sp. Rat3]|nr:hypothetical protein [Candidatus Electrothrix rattekaaiensis]
MATIQWRPSVNAFTNLNINSFSQLLDMIRNSYSGRLVDVLDVRLAS